MWHTSKVLEQRFRSACSLMAGKAFADRGGRSSDAGLHDMLLAFDTLKKEQSELASLAAQYAKQQDALRQTEHRLGMLVGNIGMHEARRNMGECLCLAADGLKRSSKNREELVRASESFSSSIDSFLSTAVQDMQTSKDKYDLARCRLQAAEGTLMRSRSAVIDPARRAILQLEVDESRKLFQSLSVQLSSKVMPLTQLRVRLCCKLGWWIASVCVCVRLLLIAVAC